MSTSRPITGTTMWAGQALPEQGITSPSGRFLLVHQQDGDLVLHDVREEARLWASGSRGTTRGRCVLQEDGNFVVYDAEDIARWASRTHGAPVRRLVVQDDGDVVLLDVDGVRRWGTGTGAGPGPRDDVPRTVGEWCDFLTSYSADYFRDADESDLDGLTDEQVDARRLGFEGAGDEAVAAVEERLGRRLPPGYRAFLEASDGGSNLSPFVYSMRTTETIGWLADVDPGFVDVQAEDEDLAATVRRSLAISDEGDATTWYLDPEDVSPDGEWAAHSWSSWAPEGVRFHSFAELVVAEREAFEDLRARDGRPVRSDGVDGLIAEARSCAARGEVDAALDALKPAVDRGSGLAAYLRTLLVVFVAPDGAQHRMRDAFAGPVGRGEVDVEHVRAELLPLYLRWCADDPQAHPGGYLPVVGEALPGSGDWEARAAAFVPPVLPEPPAFQQALDRAREPAAAGEHDRAWALVEAALPEWHSDSPYRIAPVVLLTDPAFRHVVTPDRYLRVVTTPRVR